MLKKLIVFGLCLVCCLSRSYYDILGLKKRASLKQIKSAFRRLSKKFHPDRNKEDGAREKFEEIAEAYSILKDKELRSIYDRHGKEGLEQKKKQGGGGFGDIQDIFSQFFGEDFGGGGNRRQRVNPLKLKLRVSLQDLYVGKEFEFIISKKIVCSHCNGSGAESESDISKCPYCNGRGIKIVKQQVAPGFYQQFQQKCGHCGGEGTKIRRKCHKCHGRKLEYGYEKNTLYLEKGTRPGQKIKIDEGADERLDGFIHDLLFVVVLGDKNGFILNGFNLKTAFEITLQEALGGFKKQFKHLDGELITVTNTTPVTHPNQIIRIKGKGMHYENYSDKQGDLLLVIKIKLPEKLSEEQEKLWERFFLLGKH